MKTQKSTPQINTATQELLNDQIVQENNASAQYLAMATWCDIQGYKGAASLLYNNAEEERQHMLKLIHYLIEVIAKPIIPASISITPQYTSLHSIFETILEQEKDVTKSIHKLVDHCLANKDYATFSFLQWFVTEQREEEKQAQDALVLFELIGQEGIGLYTIDQALGKLRKKETTIT